MQCDEKLAYLERTGCHSAGSPVLNPIYRYQNVYTVTLKLSRSIFRHRICQSRAARPFKKRVSDFLWPQPQLYGI
jgi:hypothetical protein